MLKQSTIDSAFTRGIRDYQESSAMPQHAANPYYARFELKLHNAWRNGYEAARENRMLASLVD